MDVPPREVFDRMRERWLGGVTALDGEDMTDDVVVEGPFAPPGEPRRIEGRQAFLDYANPRRTAFPVRFDACRTLAVHDTTDPATIVVEYELTGTSTATGRQSTAGFVGVLTVRDGKVARWREYQDTLAIMTALGAQ